jgi:hypothetical protein
MESEVSKICGYEIGTEYLSVAGKWLDKKKYCVINMITAAVLRGLWLTRNDFVSNKQVWSDVKLIWRSIRKLSSEWMLVCKEENLEMMRSWLSFLDRLIQAPLQILNE